MIGAPLERPGQTNQERTIITLPTFKAFLSHRYKSPEVSQRFFDLLTAYADIQFEVDVGSMPTNVTRLERFVRDADAFVGIYPFPSNDDGRPSRETILEESKYFRLELDLAIKSGQPGIVFVYLRYGSAITVPSNLRECRYDHREVANSGPLRHEDSFREQARAFAEDVAAVMRRHANQGRATERDRVGMLLHVGQGADAPYTATDVERLAEQLRNLSLNPVEMDLSRGADGEFMRRLEGLDWGRDGHQCTGLFRRHAGLSAWPFHPTSSNGPIPFRHRGRTFALGRRDPQGV